MIVKENDEMKTQALWLLSNIVLNSMADLQAVENCGILSNVAMSCKKDKPSIQKEAIYTLANLVSKLCDKNELALLRRAMVQYEIESSIMEVLSRDYRSYENQTVALDTWETLFKREGKLPNKTKTEGQIYK